MGILTLFAIFLNLFQPIGFMPGWDKVSFTADKTKKLIFNFSAKSTSSLVWHEADTIKSLGTVLILEGH